MFQVPLLVVLLGLVLCILPSRMTMAQQFSASGVVYEAARNKIGLMRYCRKNELLDSAIADRAVTAVETGLRKPPPGDIFAREQGDRAQQAGEDGFWEAGRRRDIASIARLFRTTPADLCQEWADETLRAQALRSRRKITTIAVVAPHRPPSQAEPAPFGPTQADRQPPRVIAVVRAVQPAPPPPLPEKAPLLPTGAKLASLQRTLPTDSTLSPADNAVPQPSTQAVPLSAPLAAETPGPLAREETVAAEATPDRLYEPSPPQSGTWPFNPLGKRERCLMAGCKWPAAHEKRSW